MKCNDSINNLDGGSMISMHYLLLQACDEKKGLVIIDQVLSKKRKQETAPCLSLMSCYYQVYQTI